MRACGSCFFILTMVLTVVSIDRLVRVRQVLRAGGNTATYTGLMHRALGSTGEMAALFSIFLANYGS